MNKRGDIFHQVVKMFLLKTIYHLKIMLNNIQPFLKSSFIIIALKISAKYESIISEIQQLVEWNFKMPGKLLYFVQGDSFFPPNTPVGTVITNIQQFRNFVYQRKMRRQNALDVVKKRNLDVCCFQSQLVLVKTAIRISNFL